MFKNKKIIRDQDDEIFDLMMRVTQLDKSNKPSVTICGTWENGNEKYFKNAEDADIYELTRPFPNDYFIIKYFGKVNGFNDVITIKARATDKSFSIYSPDFDQYYSPIPIIKDENEKYLSLKSKLSLYRIYDNLNKFGAQIVTDLNFFINKDKESLKEQIKVLEENLGSSVRTMADDDKSPMPKINPLATIYGCQSYANEENWFFSKEEFDDFYPNCSHRIDYTVIDFFGNIAGCQDVMKISAKCPNAYNFSCIYTPNFDDLDFSINNTVQMLGIGKTITFYGSINLNTIYDLLTENGIEVETNYKSCGIKESSTLVKNPNEAKKNTN